MPPRTARVISTAIGSLLVVLISGVWGVWLTGAEQAAQSSRDALLARANVAELDTEYVAPPGDSLTHHTSGFAKTLCSAVFVTGLDADFAAENVGFFSAPYEQRAHVTSRGHRLRSASGASDAPERGYPYSQAQRGTMGA